MAILHVEDDASFAFIVAELMRGLQQPYRHVATIDAAWKSLQRGPALILCDQHLPDGAGLDLVRRLRQAGRGDRFVLVSGLVDDETRRAAEAAGVDQIIEKGVDLDDLEKAVSGALEQVT